MHVIPSVPSIAVHLLTKFKLTREEILRLVLRVIQYDIVAGTVHDPVVLQQVYVILNFTINTEDEPIEGE
jgi:hypothetical protein